MYIYRPELHYVRHWNDLKGQEVDQLVGQAKKGYSTIT